MSSSANTYELKISFPTDAVSASAVKQRVVDWLMGAGVDSFVEGDLHVDFNHDYESPGTDYYEQLGGNLAPISVYRYSEDELVSLREQLEDAFPGALTCTLSAMDSASWREGWKESFRPFATARFYVRPPWEDASREPGKIDLVVEPGMAFGTGQHATTKVCLQELEEAIPTWGDAVGGWTLCDVGTGSGILAVAAAKLGFGNLVGTDIEEDAVKAARENAERNGVSFEVFKGSVPDGGPYEVVVANILSVVLVRIMSDLVRATAPGGHLLLSGILNSERAELVRLAEAEGCRLESEKLLDDWVALRFQKPAGGSA